MAIVVDKLTATFVPGRGAADYGPGLLNLAKAEDNQVYSVKLQQWRGHHIPLRLANELFYHALGGHNNLPMPNSAILEIGGILYWGSQVVSGLPSLTPSHEVPLNEGQLALLTHTFTSSDDVRLNFAKRAINGGSS